jgi:hypothetical protein
MNADLVPLIDHLRGLAVLPDEELAQLSEKFAMDATGILRTNNPLNIAGDTFDFTDKAAFAIACAEASGAEPKVQMACMIVGDVVLGQFAAIVVEVMLGYLIEAGRITVNTTPTPIPVVE